MSEILGPERSSTTILAWQTLAGVAIAVAIGGLVAYDAPVANFIHLSLLGSYPLRRIPLPTFGRQIGLFAMYEVPFVLSMLALLVLVGLGVFLIHFPRIWRVRLKILLVLALLSYQARAVLALGRIDLLITIFCLGLWLLFLLMNVDQEFPLSPTLFLLLALFGAMLLSTLNGRAGSLAFVFGVQAKNLLLFVFLAFLLCDRDRLRFFIKTLITMTTVSCVVGILQEIVFLTTGNILAGLLDERWAFLLQKETPFGTLLRVPALFGTPHFFGNAIVVVSLLVLFLILSPALEIVRRRWLLYLAFFLLMVNLGLVNSKGAMLSFLVGSILLLYIRWPSHFFRISSVLAAVLLIAVAAAAVKPRLMHYAADKVEDEFTVGEAALRFRLAEESITQSLRRYPIIGVGLGQGGRYTAHPFGWPAHNAFLLAWAETGIVGLLLYAGVFLLTGGRIFATILVGRDRETRALGKLLLAGFLGLIISIQLEPFFQLPFIWVYWGVMEGLATPALRGALEAVPPGLRNSLFPLTSKSQGHA